MVIQLVVFGLIACAAQFVTAQSSGPIYTPNYVDPGGRFIVDMTPTFKLLNRLYKIESDFFTLPLSRREVARENIKTIVGELRKLKQMGFVIISSVMNGCACS